jgi:hypothetical protein
MATFQANLACSKEYRAKGTCLPAGMRKGADCYGATKQRKVRYAELVSERRFTRFTKSLVSSLAEELVGEDREIHASVTIDAPTLRVKFREQSSKLWKETAHLSSPAQQMVHPSYQAIMGMGSSNPLGVAALMIEDMQQNRRPWFMALSYLTQANPIKSSDSGKTDKMIKAWVEWGKTHKLL